MRCSGYSIVVTLLIFLTLSLAVSAQELVRTLTPGSTNTLSIADSSTAQGHFAYESTGHTIGDQIDLRYPATHTISNISSPSGWAFQNITVDAAEKVATYFYVGVDPNNGIERFALSEGLVLKFQVESSSTDPVTIVVNTSLTVELEGFPGTFFTAFHRDEFQVAIRSEPLNDFRDTHGLAADGSNDTEDESQNGVPNILYYAFGLGDPSKSVIDRTRLTQTIESAGAARVSYVRRTDLATAGLRYQVECSDDLQAWASITDLPIVEQAFTESAIPIDSDYERVELAFTIPGRQRFYRLAVVID